MRLKKIDKLVIESLLPPFAASFFIALFVLMMQFLWLWIDDIIGKGIDTLIIIELLGYLLVHLIPLSIPIAILIASVMVFGNLAETYELSSLKSAGVSLLRTMRGALVFGAFCSLLTYWCADYLAPVATLKYRTRLFDIKKQKPALSIQPGIFNYDFQGYTIYVGEKAADNRGLSNVIIYDYSSSSPYLVNMISAERGEMFSSNNGRFLVMDLYDGYQIQESSKRSVDRAEEIPVFIRSAFGRYTKKFDLSEFEISRSEDELFKSHQDMMNSAELIGTIDSLREERRIYMQNSRKDADKELRYVLMDSISNQPDQPYSAAYAGSEPSYFILPDTSSDSDSSLSFIDLFSEENQNKILQFASLKIQDAKTRMSIAAGTATVSMESEARQIYSWQSKYSNAVICFIFMLLGASLGAIVRKGGFGYPLLIAIVFFMIYISLITIYKKLAETLSVNAFFSAWAPVVYLLPIAILALYLAQHDTRFSFNFIQIVKRKLLKKN